MDVRILNSAKVRSNLYLLLYIAVYLLQKKNRQNYIEKLNDHSKMKSIECYMKIGYYKD